MKLIAAALATSAATGAFAIVGDVVPHPLPVVNIDLEEPLYGYADAMRAESYKAAEAKLAALKGMSDSTRGSVANLIRANAAKLEKASHMASMLRTHPNMPEGGMPAMDQQAVQRIEAQLSQDCGEPCLKFFDQLKTKLVGKDQKAWQSDLVEMMQGEYKKVQNVYKDQLETSRLAASFVKKMGKSGKSLLSKAYPLIDTPCSGDMCGLVEVVANKCNYGRVAAMATYNAVNLAVHVFGVVINVLCACIHLGPASDCILAPKAMGGQGPFPLAAICTYPYTAYSGLWKANTQIWESGILGSTKMCTMIGDWRVASPM
jgi:hypothetical protein